ncbi:MAG: CHAT domain-containing protein [Cyanobacteria bacterium P01_D01_bin.156]
MLQEFDISITAVGDNRYLVRTEQVAPGVPLAQEQFHWPIDEWLTEAATLMHNPLLGILKGESSQRWTNRASYRSGHSKEDPSPAPTLVSLGQALYNSLFERSLRDSWLTAQGVAQNRRVPLRLRLGLKGEKLQKLPWEVIHAGDRPLGTGTDVTFSRYHLERRQGYDNLGITVPDFDQPLRVLMVIAAPNDQDRLELAREAKHLKDELHPVALRSAGEYGFLPKKQLDVQLTVLEQPGRAELTQALEQGNYQALHYAGHSNLGNAGGDLYLVSRQTGLTERISGEDLAGLLSNNGVKLAVLNSCRGAYAQSDSSEVGWHEQNLAQALVNRGIPGVIAMAERIPDDVAITFTQLLYRNLKQGNSIDLCLNRTRQGLISAHGSHYSYWALPILYMQPGFDGYLASKPGDENTALDKLLLESESALAALDQTTTNKTSQLDTEDSPNNVNLDNVVETVGLDDILPYNEDDAETVKELVNQLSQPSTPEEVIPASEDEPLIPDTLETPGLDLYEQLPKKPPQPSSSDIVEPTPPSIYNEEKASTQASYVNERDTTSGNSKRRQRQIAMGMGAAAVLGLASISVNDPFSWFDNPAAQLANTSEVSPEVPPSAGISSNDPQVVVASLNTMAIEQGLKTTLVNLQDSGIGDDPVKLFAQGQLQWMIANQPLSVDSTIEPAAAMRSWEGVLDLDPKWAAAQVALGATYYEQDRFPEAIDIWLQAIGNESDQPDVPLLTPPEVVELENVPNVPTRFHAKIGLALAYYQLTQGEFLEETEREANQAYAKNYWLDAVNEADDKGLTVEAVVDAYWLWSQKVGDDWVEANKAIAN